MDERVVVAVCDGSPAGAASLVAGFDEAARRALAGDVQKIWRRLWRGWGTSALQPDGSFKDTGRDGYTQWAEQTRAAAVLVLATATFAELQKYGDRPLFWTERKEAEAVLVDRRPPWTADWVEWALATLPEVRQDYWELVHALERHGLYERTDSDAYVTALMARPMAGGTCALEILRGDPRLLESTLWRVFEVEGQREVSLANVDKYVPQEHSWSHALSTLAAEGTLDRDRLLDATLDALARDFSAYRAGWFSRFHDKLAPTPAERAARAEQYAGLLTSTVPATVAFALRHVPDDAVGPADLLPVMAADRKGSVLAALKILRRLGAGRPVEAAVVATAALAHESADVQERALALVAVLAPDAPEVQEALVGYEPVIAPSARPAYEALAAGGAPGEEVDFAGLEARALDLPPAVARALGIPELLAGLRSGEVPPTAAAPVAGEPLLDPLDAIHPVEAFDELADLLTRLIEDPEAPPEQVERALDGVARFVDRRDAFERELKALHKRASARGPLTPIDRLVLGWAAGQLPEVPDWMRSDYVDRFLSARLAEVVGLSRPAPLRSLPTHRGGWIDPEVLASRGPSIGPFDDLQARMRLPGCHPDALAPPSGRLRIKPRRRDDDPPLTIRTFDRPRLRGSRLEDPAAWMVDLLHSSRSWHYDPAGSPLRLSATWPAAHQLVQAAGAASTAETVTWESPTPAEYLALLRDGRVPVTRFGAILVAIALAVETRATRSLAAEVLAETIADGRLQADALAEALEVVAGLPDVKRVRLGASLTEAARVSPAAGHAIRLALEAALPALAAGAQRELHALLEPLNELCAAAGTAVQDRATRELLEPLKVRTSKAGRLALALSERAGSPDDRAAVAALLEARVERGERWQRIGILVEVT